MVIVGIYGSLGHTHVKKVFGKNITVKQGKRNEFLGIDFDYSKKGEVQASMIPFVHQIIKEFPKAITYLAPTPAAEHLFQVHNDMGHKLLPEEQAIAFHHTMAQLLFLSIRVRRDIQTAVSFLTTRITSPDEDDWVKLQNIIQYLFGTCYLKLTLYVNSLGIVRWWIDASHLTHWDCRGHIGTLMYLGHGAIISSSKKQKLNTKSSMGSELIGAHDGLDTVLWCKYFMEAQGYPIDENVIYQDNKSALLIKQNGKASNSKRTEHIKAPYFMIKDNVDRGEISTKYCPTEHMWEDVFTKPRQGKEF